MAIESLQRSPYSPPIRASTTALHVLLWFTQTLPESRLLRKQGYSQQQQQQHRLPRIIAGNLSTQSVNSKPAARVRSSEHRITEDLTDSRRRRLSEKTWEITRKQACWSVAISVSFSTRTEINHIGPNFSSPRIFWHDDGADNLQPPECLPTITLSWGWSRWTSKSLNLEPNWGAAVDKKREAHSWAPCSGLNANFNHSFLAGHVAFLEPAFTRDVRISAECF
jgi:hypothetical protein